MLVSGLPKQGNVIYVVFLCWCSLVFVGTLFVFFFVVLIVPVGSWLPPSHPASFGDSESVALSRRVEQMACRSSFSFHVRNGECLHTLSLQASIVRG